MYLLRISFYELGQFLQIILWIFLPVVIIALLVTTYLHYRRKRQLKEQAFLEEEWLSYDQEPMPEILAQVGAVETDGAVETVTPGRMLEGSAGIEEAFSAVSGDGVPEGNENWYQALLWMKNKYEEYREQADLRYAQLKEELARSQQRYADAQESHAGTQSPEPHISAPEPHFDVRSPEPSAGTQQQDPQERPEIHDYLAERTFLNDLVEEKNKQIESLNRLLSTIYKELDRSMRIAQNPEITSWVESTPAPGTLAEPEGEPETETEFEEAYGARRGI